jgi:hypothetical protein
MTRRQLLAWAAAAAGARGVAFGGQSAGDRVGAARDLTYQALELLSPRATPSQITEASRLLRGALDQEPNFGDAHYYRHLCLRRLNQDAVMQRRHLEAAGLYESEALRDQRDPFVFSVPRLDGNLAMVGQKWALVVGVSQFQPEIGAERLQAAANDARTLAVLLRDPAIGRFPANQVFELTDRNATTANVKARLNTIARSAKPEDIVLVYVSTHGSSRADDLRQVSYLYTYDTDVTSRDQIFGSALAMVEISGILNNRCVAQRTVVIFDTCHSGAGASAKALTVEDVNRFREGAGRYVISSCEPDQLAYEDAGNGFFTSSLVSQLRARKGCVRLRDLFATVQKDVSAKVLARHKKTQTPLLAASENAAEIVLGAPIGGSSDGCAA